MFGVPHPPLPLANKAPSEQPRAHEYHHREGNDGHRHPRPSRYPLLLRLGPYDEDHLLFLVFFLLRGFDGEVSGVDVLNLLEDGGKFDPFLDGFYEVFRAGVDGVLDHGAELLKWRGVIDPSGCDGVRHLDRCF